MQMQTGAMFLKKRGLSLIIISLFLTFFGISHTYANGNDPMDDQKMIADAKKILEGASINIENYSITVKQVTDEKVKALINGADYVVQFTPKRLPNEPPMAGGGYSVYFKRENNENKYIMTVVEQ